MRRRDGHEDRLPDAVARWLRDPALQRRLEAQCARLVVGPRLLVRHAVEAYVTALEGDPGLEDRVAENVGRALADGVAEGLATDPAEIPAECVQNTCEPPGPVV